MSYRFTRIPIPSTINSTTVKPVTDEIARTTGWVEEEEIANSVIHPSSGSVIYRYKTRHIIDGTTRVYLLLGFDSVSGQPIVGIFLPGGQDFVNTRYVYKTASTPADVIVYGEDKLFTVGLYAKDSSMVQPPAFVYLEKTTSDLAESEQVLPLYMGGLGASASASGVKTSGNGFARTYAGIVVPISIGFDPSYGSPIERVSPVVSFGPVYLVKPNGLGLTTLSDRVRLAYFAQRTSNLLLGSLITEPPAVPLSASDSNNPSYTFVVVTE